MERGWVVPPITVPFKRVPQVFCPLSYPRADRRVSMRYFIHIVTYKERIVDPEGAIFDSLVSAKAEASQSARDLMAEQLRCGRTVPLDWRTQVANEDGAVVLTIKFSSLVFEGNQHLAQRPKDVVADRLLIERARATFARARQNHAEIKDGLSQLEYHVRTLAGLNSAMGRLSR